MWTARFVFAALALVLSLGARADDGAWFGANVETVTPAMKAEKGLAFGHGALVTAVEEGSPAADAGLAEGDVILSVNDAPVMDGPAFDATVAKLGAGTAIKLDRMRGKEAAALTVTLAARPETDPAFKGYLGVDLADLTEDEAKAVALGEAKGAKVVKPREGGPAAAAGILPEDRIVALDGAPMADMATLVAAVGKRRPGETAKVGIVRQSTRLEIALVLGTRPQNVSAAPARLMLDTGGHMALDRGLTFTPDGNFLLSAAEDKTIRVWDWRTGKTARTIRGESGAGPEGKVYAIALSPDGARLAVGGWMAPGRGARDDEVGSIRLYDFATGRLLALLKGHRDVVLGLAFSHDGRRLVSGSGDYTAIVWEIPEASEEAPRFLHQLIGHQRDIYAVGFTPDGERAVTGSYDKTLRLWDLSAPTDDGTTMKSVVLEGHTAEVYCLAVSAKDGTIASGSVEDIRLWDGKTGKFLRELARQPSFVGALAFSPDGTKLVSTCGGGPPCKDEPQIVWSVPTGEKILEVKHHDNIVLAAAVSPDGRVAATAGGNNNQVMVWDLATGALVNGPDGEPLALAGVGASRWATGISADGRWIAWGNTDDYQSNNARGPLEFGLRLPADGEALGSPERIGAKEQGPERVGSPNADVETSTVHGPAPGTTSKPETVSDFLRATAAHGAYEINARAGGDYRHAANLDITENGELVASLELGSTNGYSHRSYTFTPDGGTIISGGGNGVLQAFDLAEVIAAAKDAPDHTLRGNDVEKLSRRFNGHEGDVWAVTPSADGKYLLTGANDQTVRIWSLATQELIVTMFHSSDGEWAMWTEQGFYTGSPGAGALVGWQVNQGPDKAADYVRGVQLRKTLLRPDIVERAIILGGAKAAIKEAGFENVSIETLATHQPPVIMLSAAPQAAGGRSNVIVESEPNPLPITSVSISVGDGKQETKVEARTIPLPPGTPTPEKGAIRRAYEVPLFKGANTVRIVAANAGGESEPREVKIAHNGEGALDKRGTLWVLAIGVNDYPGAQAITDPATGKVYRYKRLTFAGADAKAFAETAVSHMSGRHTKVDAKVLVNGGKDGEPTRANIVAALERIRAGSTDTDTVLILLAGHGENWEGGRYHFLPTDLRRSVTTDTGENVLDWTTNIQPAITGAKGRKLLFLDACHSGNAYNRTLLAQADADRFVAFSAAGPGEEALEFASDKHGAFTNMLIEAFKGAAAALDPLEKGVTVYKLGDYVNVRVREKTFGRQTPEFRSGQGNFVLTRK